MATTAEATAANPVFSFFEKPLVWTRVVLGIFGILCSFLILFLSFIKQKESFNVGPRIFAANLMLVNIVLGIVSLAYDYGQVDGNFSEFYYSLGDLVDWVYAIQSLMLLIFNCSFVPMMAVTLISVYSTHMLSTTKTTVYFAGAVIAADILPTIFQVINVLVIIPPDFPKAYVTVPYVAVCYAMYATQLVITAVALTVIYKKSQSQHFSGRTKEEATNKLVRTLLFAIGPCVIQIPFACLLPLKILGITSKFLVNSVFVVFALKPTVDAVSLLLFMGEYRQYTMSFIRVVSRARRGWTSKIFMTKVEYLPPGVTVSVSPGPQTRIQTIA